MVTRVVYGRSAAGPWQAWRREPSGVLAGSVIEMWAAASSDRGAVHRVLPNGEVSLTFHLGAPQHIVEHGQCFRRGFIAGLQEHPLTFVGSGALVAARLTPTGAWRLLGGLPQNELAGQVVALDAALTGVDRVRERMLDAGGLAAALDVLEGWLASRLHAAPLPRVASGLSARRQRELALCQIGIPAGRLARIQRFRRAIDRLTTGDGDLATVAVTCGYYDQAHMNRDFRDFAGTTPRGYAIAHDAAHTADVLRR